MPNPDEMDKLNSLRRQFEREDSEDGMLWEGNLITTEGLERRDKFNGSDIEADEEDEDE